MTNKNGRSRAVRYNRVWLYNAEVLNTQTADFCGLVRFLWPHWYGYETFDRNFAFTYTTWHIFFLPWFHVSWSSFCRCKVGLPCQPTIREGPASRYRFRISGTWNPSNHKAHPPEFSCCLEHSECKTTINILLLQTKLDRFFSNVKTG